MFNICGKSNREIYETLYPTISTKFSCFMVLSTHLQLKRYLVPAYGLTGVSSVDIYSMHLYLPVCQ